MLKRLKGSAAMTQRTGSSKEMIWYTWLLLIVHDCHDWDVQITASTCVSDPSEALHSTAWHCIFQIRVAGTELAARLPWFGGAFTRRTAPSNINEQIGARASEFLEESQSHHRSHRSHRSHGLALQLTPPTRDSWDSWDGHGSVGSQAQENSTDPRDYTDYTRMLQFVFRTGIRTLRCYNNLQYIYI